MVKVYLPYQCLFATLSPLPPSFHCKWAPTHFFPASTGANPEGLLRTNSSGGSTQEGLPRRHFSPLPHHPLTANESLYQASGGCPVLTSHKRNGFWEENKPWSTLKEYFLSIHFFPSVQKGRRFMNFTTVLGKCILFDKRIVCLSDSKFSGLQLFFPFQSLLIKKTF